MKKIYSFALAAVAILSAASCQKEMANAPEVENGEKFTVVATAADTKTVLEGNVAYWMPGDKITIFDATGEPVVFTTNITEKAAKAEFTAESFNAPDSLVAVYNPTRSAALTDGKIYPLRAGGDQKPVAGSFDPDAAIAVGGSKAAGSNELVFNNVHSLVKFTVGDVVPSSVKVVNNGGAILVGLVSWNVEAAAIEHSGAGESSVTVSGTYEKGQTYYISVLPNEAKGGLSVYFDDVLVKNTGADLTIKPNTIYNLGTLPAAAEEEPAEPVVVWEKSLADYSEITLGNPVHLANSGNALLLGTGTAVHAINPVDGAYVQAVALPEEFAPTSLTNDDAGNIVVMSGCVPYGVTNDVYALTSLEAEPIKVATLQNDCYSFNAGNLRAGGDVTTNGVISLFVDVSQYSMACDIVDGVAGGTQYSAITPLAGAGTAWDCANGCVAPLGNKIADGLLATYYTQPALVTTTGGDWTAVGEMIYTGNDNNCAIAEVVYGDVHYAAVAVGSHFNYSATGVHVYDLASGEIIYSYTVEGELNNAGATADVAFVATDNGLYLYFVDLNKGVLACIRVK